MQVDYNEMVRLVMEAPGNDQTRQTAAILLLVKQLAHWNRHSNACACNETAALVNER